MSTSKFNLLFTGKRDIDELCVKCDNAERKCEWEGTVGTLKGHVARCEFTLITCPNQCKDNDGEIVHIMRRQLGEHLEIHCPNRSYKCKHCGKNGRYAEIMNIHDRKCMKKKVSCPNAECTKTVERRKLKLHRQFCPFTEMPCKFATLGCDVKVQRKDKTSHEQDDKTHLHVALDTVVKLQA